MIIELGSNKKLRFDENDIRVSIDGDVIDVGARPTMSSIMRDVGEIINEKIPSGTNYMIKNGKIVPTEESEEDRITRMTGIGADF